ncbi:15856_t:CDS:2, partial [Funneliformis mosseae]
MSKEKYSDYFDEYPADSWSYSSFIRYVFNKRLLPSNPIRVYNHQYKKCLEVIEQKYSPLTRENSKATLLKNSFKHNLALSQVNTKQGAIRSTLGFLGMLSSVLDKKMEEEWLSSLNNLAKNEETEEFEYHASLNKNVREEKIIYSNHLLESRKSKHKINIEEETRTTSTDPIIDTKDEDEDVFNQPPSKRVKNNDPEKQRTPKRQKYLPETSGEICNKSIKESESNSPNHDEFDTSDTVDDNDDDSEYVESSSCEETKVTKSARKLNSDEESIKEPESNSPLHDEFVKEIYNTEEDYSDESVNDNNDDDPNDPYYVYSPSSSYEETNVTKSARKLNSDEETPSVSPAKRNKLNEDTILDVVSDLNENASFNYGLRNYEEGIIIDPELPELALQETDEESVPASERLFDKDTWKKWKLESGTIVADLLDRFARKKGHPLRPEAWRIVRCGYKIAKPKWCSSEDYLEIQRYTRRATISNRTETISRFQRQKSLESLGQSIEEIRLLNNIHKTIKDEAVRKLLLEELKITC